jgi:hypothetical protein
MPDVKVHCVYNEVKIKFILIASLERVACFWKMHFSLLSLFKFKK